MKFKDLEITKKHWNNQKLANLMLLRNLGSILHIII